MARYRIVALPTMDKGGIFKRKKNQPPPQVTHTAIDPAYLEEHPDFASSIQNMPEVGTSYTRKRDKWGRPEGDPYYQFDKKKKTWIDDQGRSYRPQWKIDEDIKRKEENKSWGQRIGDWINQDVLGYPSDKELSKQMAKAKPKVFVDPSGKKHTGHGYWDNYGDAGVQMVYPEAYVMGPAGGGAGMAKQGINALMEGVAATNKFALNDLLSAGVRSTLSPIERQIAEKATVGNVLGAYGAADAVVNKAPKLVDDVSSIATQGYSNDKALDALKQAADIGTSFMGYTSLANAKNLNKAKDVYSLSKATASNLEDPTNLKDQYSFYRNLGKLSGIKQKGGFLKRKRKKQEIESVEPLDILQPGEELFPLPISEKKELYYEPISLKEMSPEELEAYKKSVEEEQKKLKYESDKAAQPGYFDEAKQWVEDWHNSPMYNQMILNSNWGQQKNADYQTKLRKKNIQTIPSLNVVEKSADKEGSKLPSTMSTAAHSLSDTGQIEVFPEGYDYGPSLFIHEILHSSDRPRELYKWNHPSYYTGKVFDEYSPNNITSEEFDKVVGKNDSYFIDSDRNGEILDYPDWMIYKDPRFPNDGVVWHDRVMPNKDQMYITTHRGSNWKDNEKYKLNKEKGFFKIKTDKEVEEGLSWLDKSDPDYKEFFLLDKNFPYEMIKAGKKDWKEFGHNYVSDPTEVRARLGEIRYNAQKEGIYDPFTQQITPEIFQNYINKERDSDHWQPMKPIDELREDYTDEEILWMLQNISKNKSEQDDLNTIQYGKKGGSVELELSDEEIQDYINQGYVVEETAQKMSSGGKVVSELWTEITGTPWREAKARGLTTGTFDENIALRNRLLAGEFGKINNAVSPKTNYDLTIEQLVKKGKTLDDLVAMRAGTRSGLKNRFPELFDEDTKQVIENQINTQNQDPVPSQTIINQKNPTNGLGISQLKLKPYEFTKFDLTKNWGNPYSDFGKPKKENKSEKKENKSDKKDADNFYKNLGVEVTKSDVERMKKNPIIKDMFDRMEANNKKLRTTESKPLRGSTMPLGPMARDISKMDFSQGKNNMTVPLGTPMTPAEKLWASIPKSAEEVLETEWGQWGAKKILDLDILPKSKNEQLKRKLEKEGVVNTPDAKIKLNKEKEAKTKLPEVKPKVDKFYQEVATVKDSYDSDNTLLSYRNQWDNDEGFVYYATPVKKDRSENDEYSDVKGVGHFLLDASASQSKPYTHQYNKSLIERAKRNNDYIPVFTPEKGDYVRLKYKRANDLKKDDKVITPLRQMKFDEIDFSQTQTPIGFKQGINEVKRKDGQGTYLLFKDRDGYSRFSGGSVVFIFKDRFGNTIVRDFAGSLNQIENEGVQIKKRYQLGDNDLVIGYHDVGSFSAKIKANSDNKLKAKQWEGFNNEDWTGGALLIPQ